jgi:hypothetical protein
MIEDRRNAVVRRDLEKVRLELFSLANGDRENFVRQPGLFEEYRNLIAVRRCPVV